MQRPDADEGGSHRISGGRARLEQGTASANATGESVPSSGAQQADQCGRSGVRWKRKNAVQRYGDRDRITDSPAVPCQDVGFYPEQDGEPHRAQSRGRV